MELKGPLTAGQPINFRRYLFFDSSTISLLTSNLVVMILAVLQNWDLGTLLWIYWFQSVIIGFFNFFRILALKDFSTENFKINNRPVEPTEGTKLYTAFFFAFHYGLFHFAYAEFLGIDFLKADANIGILSIIFGSTVFFINHFFSFRHNIARDSEVKQNIGTIMFFPYARIIPMHLIIVIGASTGGFALILFLSLKTVADLVMHTVKHRMKANLSPS